MSHFFLSFSAITLAAASLPTVAQATESTPPAQATLAPSTVPDQESLTLATEFAELMYPASENIDQLRSQWLGALDSMEVEDAAYRTAYRDNLESAMSRIEPVMRLHFPALQHAYAEAFAREFTKEELRDLLGFAKTPTGRHFLRDTTFADSDDVVLAVSAGMEAALEPAILDFQKAMCKRAAKLRVAAGDNKAKCSMA